MLWFSFKKANWHNVDEMYNYAKDNNLKLLSNYSSDFWADYLENSDTYDRAFRRMYKSYRYFEQEPYKEEEDNEIETVTNDFIDAVYDYLLLNDKKYSELYKLKVLNIENLSPLDDYNMVETMDGTKAFQGTFVKGSRTDSESETLGSRQDSTSSTLGSREDNTVRQKEGFNSNVFADDNKNINSYGQQLNSGSNTIGSQTNSSSFIKGGQSDTDNHSEDNDYTLSRKGSNTNPYSNIDKYTKAWSKYEFMTYIFKEICAELLLV